MKLLSEDFFAQSIQLGSLRNEDRFIVTPNKKRAAPTASGPKAKKSKVPIIMITIPLS